MFVHHHKSSILSSCAVLFTLACAHATVDRHVKPGNPAPIALAPSGLNDIESIQITISACEPQWMPGFGTPGVNNPIYALTVFDSGSGSGPALYAGGFFTIAGEVPANSIAKWDGGTWSSLGSGMNNGVFALAVFDDGSGSGPALYASGQFTTAGDASVHYVAKWDGTEWSSLDSGMNNSVWALTVFDDGTGGGPALIAGGQFSVAGGVDAAGIAKWDGNGWSPLGPAGGGVAGAVHALAVFDDGSGDGPALYAGGVFSGAGGLSANNIAKWDGTAWSSPGNGMNDRVHALTTFDDGSGSGSALYAGGDFTVAGSVMASRIARWDGTSWSSVGNGVNNSVRALFSADDGSDGGPALYAGGDFTFASGAFAGRIGKWDGASWSSLGMAANDTVRAISLFDDGSGVGPALHAAGSFASVGGVAADRIARWDNTAWSTLGNGTNDSLYVLTVFDDGFGGGPALYAGGFFSSIGGVAVNSIARWNGSAWSPLGSGMNSSVHALGVFDDGSGSGAALYAGGWFTTAGGVPALRIAKWDGLVWSALGSGMSSQVTALEVFDDGSGSGPALFAGGSFTTAGGVPANRIARWDGTAWHAVGTGMGDRVSALRTFDDGLGDGPALYAGGAFTMAGGMSAPHIARWDGTEWSALGSGMNEVVSALSVFDDGSGSGPALYAGGMFTDAGGVPADFIAAWDGTAWSSLGSGMNERVSSLTSFDDGSGPALYAGGWFAEAGGTTANRIARWDGTAWSSLGSGMSGGTSTWILAIAAIDHGNGDGAALYAAGGFTSAGGVPSSRIAKWQGCLVTSAPCSEDLDSDGIVGLDDVLALTAAWGACADCPEDLNGDGVVDAADLLLMLKAWGECP